MGRKTKKIIPNHYSRTYLFRPRNGLGLYYPKIKSISTSSIFHYNQRNVSPEHALDNDEDIVEGVLFTSYKELRGLESHSPLPYCLESSGDEDHGSKRKLIPQDDGTELARSQNSFNYANSRYIYESDSVQKCNISESIVTKSFGKLRTMHSCISNDNVKLTSDSTIHDSKTQSVNIFDHVELFPTSNFQMSSENEELIPKRSHTFLIENILRENKEPTLFNQNTSSNAPLIINSREMELNHVDDLSLLSKNEGNSSRRRVGSHISDSSFSHVIPLLPEINPFIYPSQTDPAYQNSIKDTFSLPPDYISSFTPPNHTHLNPIDCQNKYTIFPDYSSSFCKLQPSPPFLGFSQHDYTLNVDNIAPQSSVNRISRNSLFPPQKRNYKTCMNHANIAWSIYAKETHLWEEESREKGLYPLSLHSKQCYNRTVLRPKAFREIACDMNNTVEGSLFPSNLSPFSPDCSVFNRDLSQLSHPVSNIHIEQETSDQILKHIHSKIVATNELYERSSKSFKLSPNVGMMDVFNSFPFHVPLNALPKVEQSSDQYMINRSCMSNIYPSQHVAFDDKLSHNLPQLNSNYNHFLHPILSTHLFRPSLEDSNCQVSNIPLFTLHPIEPNTQNLQQSINS